MFLRQPVLFKYVQGIQKKKSVMLVLNGTEREHLPMIASNIKICVSTLVGSQRHFSNMRPQEQDESVQSCS